LSLHANPVRRWETCPREKGICFKGKVWTLFERAAQRLRLHCDARGKWTRDGQAIEIDVFLDGTETKSEIVERVRGQTCSVPGGVL
jgi:hypothetical protein